MLSTEWDWEEALEVAREEGWEDGHEEGMEKGRTEGLEEGMELAAYNALLEGASTDFVQKITGLKMNAIEAIKAKL